MKPNSAGVPAPIVHVPARSVSRLRGKRVVIGVPGLGWRADLRADDPVVQASRTYVPVLSEQDYYRAELEQLEAFAPLVPIERVWVEHVTRSAEAEGGPETAALDAPPRRQPVPALMADHLLGRRIIQTVPDGEVRDLRAVTELYYTTDGLASLQLCGEVDWYRWGFGGAMPRINAAQATTIWLE
jgi:hypothetical protein